MIRTLLFGLAMVQLSSGTDIRGSKFQWTRAEGALTIEIETKYSQNKEQPTNCGSECQLLYTMGDGNSYLAYETSAALTNTYVGVDGADYDILTYRGSHTYESAKRWKVGVNTCCRVESLNVADTAAHLVTFYIDLTEEWNVGSPSVGIPLTLQVKPGDLTAYKIPITLNPADTEKVTVVCTNSPAAASGINQQVTAEVSDEAPYVLREDSGDWYLDFDATGFEAGGRFALQFIVAESSLQPDLYAGDTVIVDMVVELVDTAASPTVEPESLNILNCINGETKSQSFVVSDSNAGLLTMTYELSGTGSGLGWFKVTVESGTTSPDGTSVVTVASGTTHPSGTTYIATMEPNDAAHSGTAVDVIFTFTNTAGKSVAVTQQCSVVADKDCEVSYTDWTDCSENCDGGNQTRTRRTNQPRAGLGAACPAMEAVERDCNTGPCGFTCVTTEGPEGCKTCRDIDSATADGQCGTCHNTYGVNRETYECYSLNCLGKGYQETWINGEKYSQCRTCKHLEFNNPNDPDDLSCDCDNVDTRALVQPKAAKLIMDDSGSAYYTQLDQGIVSIVFEESTAIHRAGAFGPDDFVIYSEENVDAGFDCKNEFTWDSNPDPEWDTENTSGNCPLRRVWHGQVPLTTLMGDCGVRIPPNEEAVDNELVVKVRFGVVGQRAVRLEDDAAGSVTERYIWQQVQTMLPLLYYFPLSVEVESPPAKLFNAASKTVIRVTFDAYIEDEYPAYEEFCNKLIPSVEESFPSSGVSSDGATTTCKIVLGNQVDAATQADRDWGHVTIELYAPPGILIDTLIENGECDEFKARLDSGGDVVGVTWDQEFISAGGTRANEYSCGPVSELFAVRATSEVKVWLKDSTREYPMVEIGLFTAIDTPFELGSAVAPWQDTRFDYEWQPQQNECPEAEGECDRHWVLFMADKDGVCTFDGTYQVRFGVKCRASANVPDASGLAFQCPVQSNYQEGGAPFVTVTFEIQSGEHCPKIGGQVYLDAAMFSYRFDPEDKILGGVDDQAADQSLTYLGAYENADKPRGDQADNDPISKPALEFHAFINNQRMYFRAQVRSDEAALSVAYFTAINIVEVDEAGESKDGITAIFQEQANTGAGDAVGLTVSDAATVHAGNSDPKAECRVVDSLEAADCWLLPSFSMQADVSAEVDGKNVFPVARRSSASFKFTGTIAVQYVAGGIGANRRLLHFVSPGQARRLAEVQPDQTAETAASFDFDPSQEYKDSASANTNNADPSKPGETPEYSAGFKSSLSGVVCMSMVVLCLLL